MKRLLTHSIFKVRAPLSLTVFFLLGLFSAFFCAGNSVAQPANAVIVAQTTRATTPASPTTTTPAASESLPPEKSWEQWILALKKGGKEGLPGRPDGLPLTDPLPAWVDCYFSHLFDQPNSPKNPLMTKLVLRANSKMCSGGLSEWAE